MIFFCCDSMTSSVQTTVQRTVVGRTLCSIKLYIRVFVLHPHLLYLDHDFLARHTDTHFSHAGLSSPPLKNRAYAPSRLGGIYQQGSDDAGLLYFLARKHRSEVAMTRGGTEYRDLQGKGTPCRTPSVRPPTHLPGSILEARYLDRKENGIHAPKRRVTDDVRDFEIVESRPKKRRLVLAHNLLCTLRSKQFI